MNWDAKELFGLYTRRRDAFASQLEPGNDPYIQALLVQVIRHTDLCMEVATDLVMALIGYTKRVGEVFEQDTLLSKQIMANAKSSLGNISSITDEQIRSQLIQLIKQSTHRQLESGGSTLELTEAIYQFVDSTADRFIDSLQRGIFKRGDEEEALKALGVLLEFLISLIPILGTLAGGYSAIRDIVDKQKEAKEATTYMKGLKDYATATFYWAVSAQVFIDGIMGAVSASATEDARLDSAMENITKRLEGLAA